MKDSENMDETVNSENVDDINGRKNNITQEIFFAAVVIGCIIICSIFTIAIVALFIIWL